MKAEIIGKIYHKQCPTCSEKYNANDIAGLTSFFCRSVKRYDGLDAVCKDCRKKYRAANKAKELARWKKYYAKGSDNRRRHVVRAQTRKQLGKASAQVCQLCNKARAEEWHHLSYSVSDVQALCATCHENIS